MQFKPVLLPVLAGLFLCIAITTQARDKDISATSQKPLSFIENKGQIVNQHQEPRADIDFRIAGNGVNLFVGAAALHYQWAQPSGATVVNGDTLQEYALYRMDVELLGANPNAQVVRDQKQGYYERYYTPAFGQQGAVAHSYQKITYKEVYPNIDWVLYVSGNKVEYDFVVRPGGRVADIQLQYSGATQLNVNTDGSVMATTPMGSVREAAPVAFQQADSKPVASSFSLDNNVLSFSAGDYEGTLVIDPVLEWGTYYGGLYSDVAAAIVADASGNTYLCGITASTANIATTGAHQTTYGGPSSTFVLGDAFLSKFSGSGTLLWATYYGGSDEDRGSGVALDESNGALYLAGSTKSTDAMATAGAHQVSPGGNWDAFLARFDTAGMLQWATYYGGSGAEGTQHYSIGVACDNNGHVILSGDATSTDNIASPGAQQTLRNGNRDGFLVKFDGAGLRLWATYFGGDNEDYGKRVAVDADNNIYLSGYTNSASGLSTPGSYQPDHSGEYDAFLAKYDPAGELQWATYFGGPSYEEGHALCVGDSGNVFIGGYTMSASGISTAGSHQAVFGDGYLDGFLAKFTPQGQVAWATYYGGADIDLVSSLSVSENNDLFIAGTTMSHSGIGTANGYCDTLNNQSYDAFFAKFSTEGVRQWGSYFGSTGNEDNCYLTITNNEELLLTGFTNSATGIATANSHQPQFGGGNDDAYLVKFNVCEQPPAPLALTGDTLICEGGGYTYSIDNVPGAIAYQWILPVGWSGSSDSTGITVTPGTNSGNIAVVALNNCAASDTISLDVTVNPAPLPVIQQSDNVLSTTESFTSYQWIRNDEDIADATEATYTAVDTGMYSVRVTSEAGCGATSASVAAGSTAIADLAALSNAISVYPNPASNIVQIQAPVAIRTVVSSIEGKRLWKAERSASIDVSHLAPGMYLLQVYDGDSRLLKTIKLVKEAN